MRNTEEEAQRGRRVFNIVLYYDAHKCSCRKIYYVIKQLNDTPQYFTIFLLCAQDHLASSLYILPVFGTEACQVTQVFSLYTFIRFSRRLFFTPVSPDRTREGKRE